VHPVVRDLRSRLLVAPERECKRLADATHLLLRQRRAELLQRGLLDGLNMIQIRRGLSFSPASGPTTTSMGSALIVLVIGTTVTGREPGTDPRQ